MEDTVKTKDHAIGIAKLIDEHNGADVSVINIVKQCNWTDYFIIATVSSQGHINGLTNFLRAYLAENDIKIIHNRKRVSESGWMLLDCADIVIHLMNEELRNFYDLEKLWHTGEIIYHSSKSS